MKRIGLILLSIILALNLCVGFSRTLAEDISISNDGMFQYKLHNDNGTYSAIVIAYLGSEKTLVFPKSIDGYIAEPSYSLANSLDSVQSIVLPDARDWESFPFEDLDKLQSIQLVSNSNYENEQIFMESTNGPVKKYLSYDGCIYYKMTFVDNNDYSGYYLIMIPGGKKELNIYNGCNYGQYDSGGNLSVGYKSLRLKNVEKINVDEANEEYASLEGVLVSKDKETLIDVPGAWSGSKRIVLPAGFIESFHNTFPYYDEVVFPNGMKTYIAAGYEYYLDRPWYLKSAGVEDPLELDGIGDSVYCRYPSVLHFPSSLEYLVCNNLPDNEKDSSVGYTGQDTTILRTVTDIYFDSTEEAANNNIKLYNTYEAYSFEKYEDPSKDLSYKGNVKQFCSVFFPNATIHYAKAIKTGAIKNGTITVQKDSELEGNPVAITVKANEGYQLKKLAVTDETGKEVKVKDNQFTMPDSDVMITAEFEKKSNGDKDNDNTPATTTYTDVPVTGKWYSKAVYYATEKGYMAGTGNNKFSPEGTVTRGTIAQILYAAENKPTVTGKSKFSDVASGKWYANAVNWAADKGLVTGYGNGKFGPDDRITREQMVAIMMQYSKMKRYDLSAKADLSKYPDQSKISKWAVNAVKWGVSHKIISGTDKGLEPKGNATRAQIAVILQAYDNNLRK